MLAAPRFEHRAFFHVDANEEDEERRGDADHEHAPPADRVEQQEIDEAGDEIARRIATLKQARNGAAQLAPGSLSMTRLAPRPHSPPIAIPKRKRRTRRLVSDGREARRELKDRKER